MERNKIEIERCYRDYQTLRDLKSISDGQEKYFV